jgi:type I restriction enzyme S subunit
MASSCDTRVLDWLGYFPKHWNVENFNSVFTEVKTKNRGLVEKRVLSLSYGNVIIKPLEKLRGLIPESFETYQILKPGDIVVRPTDLQNDQTSLRVGLCKDAGIITSAYISLRSRGALDNKYGSLVLKAYDFEKVFYGYGSGLRQNLDFKHLKYIPIPIPSLEEQLAIIKFVDHLEIRVARAISAKIQLQAKLEEKRISIIDSLVLGRNLLNSDRQKTDYSWLGSIPTSWDIEPLRAFLKPSKNTVGELSDNYVLLSLTKNGVIVRDLSALKGKFPASFNTYQVVQPEDFIFCLFDVDETPRTVGRSNHSGMITGAYDVFKPTGAINPEYLLYQLLSFDNLKKLKPLYRGLRKVIPRGSFMSLRIAVPSQIEQINIISQINQVTNKIDKALLAVKEEIALLREYRTRVISDVVLGKKDVRSIAENLPSIAVAEMEELSLIPLSDGEESEERDDD